MDAGWLATGLIEKGRLAPTEEGTPQGGAVSPLLLNVALHGMEHAAGVRYQRSGVHAGTTVLGSPWLIRYADDLVAMERAFDTIVDRTSVRLDTCRDCVPCSGSDNAPATAVRI